MPDEFVYIGLIGTQITSINFFPLYIPVLHRNDRVEEFSKGEECTRVLVYPLDMRSQMFNACYVLFIRKCVCVCMCVSLSSHVPFSSQTPFPPLQIKSTSHEIHSPLSFHSSLWKIVFPANWIKGLLRPCEMFTGHICSIVMFHG